jgi:hypothetical protein
MGSGGTAPLFLTLALDGGEWADSCPDTLILEKKSLVLIWCENGYAVTWYACYGEEENFLFLSANEPRHPTCYYNGQDIPSHRPVKYKCKFWRGYCGRLSVMEVGLLHSCFVSIRTSNPTSTYTPHKNMLQEWMEAFHLSHERSQQASLDFLAGFSTGPCRSVHTALVTVPICPL